jgi:BlaI family penicillinase repressor
MADPEPLQMGKRERQIVETLYRLGQASVAQVRAALPDPPTYSAVRGMLNLLVEKQVLTFQQEGKRYLYRPIQSKTKMRRLALRNLVVNFFSGQPLDAVAALIDGSAGKLAPADLERIKKLIEEAEGES